MTDRYKPHPQIIARSAAAFDALTRRLVRRFDGYVVIELTAAELARQPSLIWNGFVALMSQVTLSELHPAQRPAWRAYAYDSQVQSAGHARYFDALDGVDLSETIDALTLVGATAHAELLQRAATIRQAGVPSDETFAGWDRAFATMWPSLSDLLEKYINNRRDCFVMSL